MRLVLALGMIWIGIHHFRSPGPFERIVPDYLPNHHALVLVSGIFEVAGGAGLLIPALRQPAAIGLIALFVAVFPANIDMAVHPPAEYAKYAPLLWARLALQPVLIAWAWAVRK